MRLYFPQQWFGLADYAMEDALYASQSMRQFVGVDLGGKSVPNATTLLKSRGLLRDDKLTAKSFHSIEADLSARGLLTHKGTMVGTTRIAGPRSTENEVHERGPEMHLAKKGNGWHFGMKAHIGADTASGLVHRLHATAANEEDAAHVHKLPHGQETSVFAFAGYNGFEERAEVTLAQEVGEITKGVSWYVAATRSKAKAMPEEPLKELSQAHPRHAGAGSTPCRTPAPCHGETVPLQEGSLQGAGQKKRTRLLYMFSLTNLVIAKRHYSASNLKGYV